MRLTGFDEGEVGHCEGQGGERGVFDYLFGADGFGRGKAAAVYVHVQQVCTRYHDEESEHDRSKERSPDAEAPADQHQKAENYFREGQRVGDELDSPGGEHLKGFHLESEVGEVSGNGELQKEKGPQGMVGKKRFGIAGINKDAAEDDASDPDDGAAEIHWAGLHHADAELFGELVQEIAQDFVAHYAGVRKRLALGVKHGGGGLIDIIETA